MSNRTRILPLGGLGEIGKNMTVVERDGRIVIVDVGLMFPTADQLGIDLVLPDFSMLRERAEDIEAIVLTHGHEDHVGALPYFLREVGNPPVIYGGLLTISMVRSKLDEHKLRDVPLTELPAGDKVQAGPFEIELVHMSHSIPDMRAVALRTDDGVILITGDYKFDQTPVDGKPADVSRLAELGREGVIALCGDSTNADRPGVAPSESSVGPALLDVFGHCEGRIIVTSFASNIHRVQQAIDAAVALDRKVALVGRSMRKNFNIASNLEMAHIPQGMMIQPKEIEDFPDEKVVVISTGSQGEPLSALRRMAHNDHRDVSLHSEGHGDLLGDADPRQRASRQRDGRSHLPYRRLGRDRGRCADPRVGSRLAGGAEADAEPDQAPQRDAVPRRPQAPAPARRASPSRWASTPTTSSSGRNGVALDVDGTGAKLGEDFHTSMIFVDGVSVGEPDEFAIRDRRKLSDDGVFIVVATISSDDGSQVADPEVIFRGVALSDDEDDLADDIADVVDKTLAEAAADKVREIDLIQEDLHDDIAEFVWKKLKRRPLVLPVVVEV